MTLVICMSICNCLKYLWAYFLCSSLLYIISFSKSRRARAPTAPVTQFRGLRVTLDIASSFILPHLWSSTNSCWCIASKYSSLHSLLSVCPISSLVQAIIYRDAQDCLAKNPGSSFWATGLCPARGAAPELSFSQVHEGGATISHNAQSLRALHS